MKPLWVQQFYNEWGFYPMAGGTLGDGSSWDETNPQQSTLANNLDSYDRDVRIGVRGRMANEHEWPSSQSVTSAAGQHKFITLQNQATKPTISGTQLAALYTKTVGSGLQELFWENEVGTEVQLVSRGTPIVPSGAVIKSTYVSYVTVATKTVNFVLGSTTPTYTANAQVMAVTYSPANASNTLRISAKAVVGSPVGTSPMGFIFMTTGGVVAIGASVAVFDGGAGGPGDLHINASTVAGTTGAIEIGVLIGMPSGTAYFNGDNSGNVLFGTCPKSFLKVEEIQV